MRDDAPRRLKHDPGAPPALSRALDALRKGGDDRARLERVGARLGDLLDAPPPIATSAGAAAYKGTVLKLIVGGLLLLAPLVWLMRGEQSAKPAKPVPPELAQAQPRIEGPALPKIAAAPSAGLPVAAMPAPATSTLRGEREERKPANVVAARARRAATATHQLADAPSERAAAEVAEAPELEQDRAAVQEREAPAIPKPDEAAAAAKPAATEAPPLPSEAQLLLAARKAMPDEPARALRLLGQHEQRFADGLFVPEREVLSIEALRSLGRSAEANARLQQFKAQYPDSFHLRRLQR